MNNIIKVRMGWDEYAGITRRVGQDIQLIPHRFMLQGIIAISRGGLIPATILSHQLGAPILDVIRVRSYEGGKQHQPIVAANISEDIVPMLDNVLFVDDLVDTGGTLEAIKQHYPKARFVAPMGKVSGVNKLQHDLVVYPREIVQDNVWIEFPWEVTND